MNKRCYAHCSISVDLKWMTKLVESFEKDNELYFFIIVNRFSLVVDRFRRLSQSYLLTNYVILLHQYIIK